MNIVYWIRGLEHAKMAEVSIESARKAYPGCTVLVYTESGDPAQDYKLPAQRAIISGGRPAMVANLDAQIRALAGAVLGEPFLFVDADTLIREGYVLPSIYDLGVTWRDHVAVRGDEKIAGLAKFMPYNYGVIYARARPATFEALLWLRARILRMNPQHQAWYGNQMALAELVGAPQGNGPVPIAWALTDPGDTRLNVLKLPCDTHNYTPEAAGEDVTGKVILHFKGGRKDLMEAYR
jgi:hypothetical protein